MLGLICYANSELHRVSKKQAKLFLL